ncbi:TIGR04086 family membrane protein [Bacillus sp. 165]|uniref:TIGR04086 family membrane protein n=1 Tax=Bacillus sp. 165 TaxID=1529117 RepID=UPI001ADBB514|nr:TIGR04086 family membrane protein [Bacillus sp. 165]MBO9130477.1 TIGR04086 family membrane protein [Bacillus sp. 165]
MTGTKNLGKAVIFGLCTILCLAVLMSACLSLLLKLTKIDESSLTITTLVLAVLSMLISGFVSGVKAKVKGWLAGGGTGVIFSLFVFLINYLGYSQTLSKENLLYHALLLAASTVGGIFGVNITKKA